jgi:SPP1 family predicted phage head-tail adaptor
MPRGLYNQILTLETPTVTDDGQGGQILTWAEVGTFRGRISPVSSAIYSQERQSQNKTTQFTTHRIYCDPMTVTTKERIKWGTYYFEIIGITNPSELYRHLEIDAREIGPT